MQPSVSVGLMTAPKVNFSLTGIYSTENHDIVSGRQEAEMSDSGLTFLWNGANYTSLIFTPSSVEGDSFEVDDITIGVKFHWERRENQRFRGALKLLADNGAITVINIVDVEEYLRSVISSEMSAKASINLLRAHAVISRSWLMAQLEASDGDNNAGREVVIRDIPGERIRWWDRSNHSLFYVCADDHCQRYQGIGRIIRPEAASAVDDTRGEVLTYNGKICDARFSKCCGGALETFDTCWDDTPHPYLRAVRDNLSESPLPDLSNEEKAREWIMGSPEAFCNTSNERILSQVLNAYDRETADFYRWEISISRQELSQLFTAKTGVDLGMILSLTPLKRGKSGRISRLEVKGTAGSIIIGKELEIRRALSTTHLYSSAFVVETAGDTFRFRGAGWGHGVGLCQIGAAVMGDRGFSYREILSHYYKDTEITRLY
ncbi:MAG: SpoIID/LytB domain-containing protein [Lachnoclostridium sp.]|nr:SpoIID/LytB domain-containing protein [Lachnoclostridium sp.]